MISLGIISSMGSLHLDRFWRQMSHIIIMNDAASGRSVGVVFF